MSLKEESLTESKTGQFSVLFSAGLTGPILFGGTCANESKKDINLKSLKKGKWECIAEMEIKGSIKIFACVWI